MGIRDNGNGTVTIDYRDGQNKRHRKTITGGKTLAKNILAKIKTNIVEGTFFPELQKKELTFAQAADKYWDIHLSKKKSGPKLKSTVILIKKHFGNKPLAQITTEDVQKFYNEKMAQTSAPTANRHFTTLNAIINKAIKLKAYKGENPCIGVTKGKENPARIRYLEKEEIPLLLTNTPERSRALVAFALATGMRRGEILRLEWNHIDFNNNIIHIYESKSGHPREVPIMTSLKELLLRLNPQESGKVFPLTIKALENDFAVGVKTAAIKNFHFHDLRHTFASHFVMHGGSLTDLQRILGHSTLALTQRYAHLSPAYLHKSISILNDLIE